MMGAAVVKFVAVGDLFMGEHPVTSGHGVDSVVSEKGPDFPFMHVNSTLKGGDIVLGNLEGVISDKGRSPNNFMSNCFRGRPQVAAALAKAGFTAMTLANNHTMQHGNQPLRDTVALLAASGIESTGINEDNPNSASPIIVNRNGISVAIFGYCCISQQYHLDFPVVCRGASENILSDIEALRTKVDFVVVSLHWGDEFVDSPSPGQMRLGRKLIDAGVDLIIGHHSHVLQGVERYKHGLIVYSLGSFVKDLWKQNMRESIIFECALTKNGIGTVRYIPICINGQYQPEVLTGNAAQNILGRVDRLSRRLEQEDLADSEAIERQYSELVAQRARRDRFDTYLYYLRNFFMYDPVKLLKNISTVIRRRIGRKSI